MQELVAIHFEDAKEDKIIQDKIMQVMQRCFEEEKLLNLNLYISITLTTPAQIKKLNNQYRNIDKETDVLSFPMFEKEEIDNIVNEQQKMIIKETIGDIVISVQRVEEQAKEYGHSFERELCYMLVHGFYHLMGYDHIEEEDKKKMRPKEEKILNDLKNSKIGKFYMEDNRLKNKNFIDAVNKALSGIWYGIRTQRNIKIQIVVSILVIIAGILLKLNITEFIFITLAIMIVIITEMINTAIETAVNLYTDKYHDLAKIAKDVAAGAVVLAAINAIIIAILILVNKFV